MYGVIRPVVRDLLRLFSGALLGAPDAAGGFPLVTNCRAEGLGRRGRLLPCLIAGGNAPIIQGVVRQLAAKLRQRNGSILIRIDPAGVQDIVLCRQLVRALGNHDAVSRLLCVLARIVHHPRKAQIVLVHTEGSRQKIDLQIRRLVAHHRGVARRLITALRGRFLTARQRKHSQRQNKAQKTQGQPLATKYRRRVLFHRKNLSSIYIIFIIT